LKGGDVVGEASPTTSFVMISDLNHTLQEFQVPFSMSDAKHFLERIRSSIDYLIIFQHYFPAEYTESMELIHTGRASLLPLPGEAYSPHEARLLKLVDKYLFPIPLWYILDDDTCEENRCYTVPIESFGVDLSCGEDFLEMDLGWQLIFYLIGEIQADFFDIDALEEIFALPIEMGKVDDASLQEVCARQRTPLSFFRLVIDLIDNDTGMVWLDATVEMPCDYVGWSIENIDELVKEYKEALEIKKKIGQFMSWLESDIVPHFKEVIALWNESVILARSHQETAR
jgi:hypothetical protein